MDAVVKGSSIAGANSEKAKALQAALAQIEKQFGKGTIMRLGEGEALEDIQVVSTGSLGLDIALGVGGLLRGRLVEIYGPESSGKTTLTLLGTLFGVIFGTALALARPSKSYLLNALAWEIGRASCRERV